MRGEFFDLVKVSSAFVFDELTVAFLYVERRPCFLGYFFVAVVSIFGYPPIVAGLPPAYGSIQSHVYVASCAMGAGIAGVSRSHLKYVGFSGQVFLFAFESV